uniref:Hexosyltransferase n=1 Tax=Chenopodium quinoa TaxID=63459 RepID=A0A803NCZ4_CHEQI
TVDEDVLRQFEKEVKVASGEECKRAMEAFFHVVIDRKIVAAMKMYPDLHHIVLLDGDVEVQKDLTDLWNIDLDGKVNGAVESYFGSFHGYS